MSLRRLPLGRRQFLAASIGSALGLSFGRMTRVFGLIFGAGPARKGMPRLFDTQQSAQTVLPFATICRPFAQARVRSEDAPRL